MTPSPHAAATCAGACGRALPVPPLPSPRRVSRCSRARSRPADPARRLRVGGRRRASRATRPTRTATASSTSRTPAIGGGGVRLPDVPVRVVVGPGGGRDRVADPGGHRPRVRDAAGRDGFRGAVLVEAGRLPIDAASPYRRRGVVLRGAGPARGHRPRRGRPSRRASHAERGRPGRARSTLPWIRRTRPSRRRYVPVGRDRPFPWPTRRPRAGQSRRRAPAVDEPSGSLLLGMNLFQGWRPENRLHWQPGSRDIDWDRVVTAVTATGVTHRRARSRRRSTSGSAAAARVRRIPPDRIARSASRTSPRVGVRRHPAGGRRPLPGTPSRSTRSRTPGCGSVAARHFVGSVVNARRRGASGSPSRTSTRSRRCRKSGGFRRRAFYTAGQLTLFRRCRSERGLPRLRRRLRRRRPERVPRVLGARRARLQRPARELGVRRALRQRHHPRATPCGSPTAASPTRAGLGRGQLGPLEQRGDRRRGAEPAGRRQPGVRLQGHRDGRRHRLGSAHDAVPRFLPRISPVEPRSLYLAQLRGAAGTRRPWTRSPRETGAARLPVPAG